MRLWIRLPFQLSKGKVLRRGSFEDSISLSGARHCDNQYLSQDGVNGMMCCIMKEQNSSREKMHHVSRQQEANFYVTTSLP